MFIICIVRYIEYLIGEVATVPLVKRSVSLRLIRQSLLRWYGGLWPDYHFTDITLNVKTSTSGKTAVSPA